MHHTYRAAYVAAGFRHAHWRRLACGLLLVRTRPTPHTPLSDLRDFTHLRLIVVFAFGRISSSGHREHSGRVALDLCPPHRAARRGAGGGFLVALLDRVSGLARLLSLLLLRAAPVGVFRVAIRSRAGRGSVVGCSSPSCGRAQRGDVALGSGARSHLSAGHCRVLRRARTTLLRLALGARHSRFWRFGAALAGGLDIDAHRKPASGNAHDSRGAAADGLCAAVISSAQTATVRAE